MPRDTYTDNRDRRAVRLGYSSISLCLVYCHFYCQRMHVKNCPKKPQSEQRKLKGSRGREEWAEEGIWGMGTDAKLFCMCFGNPSGRVAPSSCSSCVYYRQAEPLINHATSHAAAAAREGAGWEGMNLARNIDNGRGHCPHMSVVGRGRGRAGQGRREANQRVQKRCPKIALIP